MGAKTKGLKRLKIKVGRQVMELVPWEGERPETLLGIDLWALPYGRECVARTTDEVRRMCRLA